ncbi:response regulator [Cupriavidus sp. HPC(L)]|uniref:phosphorylase family protein n=1 Tax=Cupriavidus sp. HPC(L) TaxID=1217418 RepID=UPI0009F8B9EA|nr:response regulator [Cupriavidus sp. HPC(L)]
MKYLVIEDDVEKLAAIREAIRSEDSFPSIETADNLVDARRLLLTKAYDLVVFDVYLPPRPGSKEEQDISEDLLIDFAKSKNYHSVSIAITRYADDSLSRSRLFNDNGVTLVVYSEDNQWKRSLSQQIRKCSEKSRLDFVIFCALTKERLGYGSTDAKLGVLKNIGGLNCQEMTIGDFRGMCVKPQHMGLVNMAIAATKAIELFKPKIVAMSGICAGVEGESKLLDIVVGQVCWEWQTGKFKDGKFRQEPYQVSVNANFKTAIEQISEQTDFLRRIKSDLFDSELRESGIKIAPISSGSVVVADGNMMSSIGMQHRKWAALEMEMYALYEAAKQSVPEPLFFGAKCVVDMGDSAKGDALHATACSLSARFVIEVLKLQLPKLVDD